MKQKKTGIGSLRLAVASDLHLEFQDINLTNDEGADVLILAGDIMIAEDLHKHPKSAIQQAITNGINLGPRQNDAQRYRNFLKRCSKEFPHVIYIAGNHEFYHGRFHASIEHLKSECSSFDNVYFMENETKVIDDITFIGATLWTDCNKSDPLTQHALCGLMNDYTVIRNDNLGFTKLRPAHTMERHKHSLKFIRHVVEGNHDAKFVVVGHHSPSHQSVHPMYKNDQLMNGGYHSDLSEFILDHPEIKLWIHGHTHSPFDYNIGDTRVVCNPRGYKGHEILADDFRLKFLDI
jgi:predicted phosphodiesterase